MLRNVVCGSRRAVLGRAAAGAVGALAAACGVGAPPGSGTGAAPAGKVKANTTLQWMY